MMLTALVLLVVSQEFVIRESVQRELRLHPVSELISAPSYGWPQLSHSNAGMLWYPGEYFLQPQLAIDSAGALDGAFTLRYMRISDELIPMPRDERKFESALEIEEIATRFCQPPLDPRQERIQADDQGWLVCYLRPEQHDWLERFLTLQSESERQWMAEISTEWFTIPNDRVAGLGVDGSAELLDDAEQIARVRAQLEHASAERVSSPRLSAWPGQRAEISSLSEVSYVKEYKLEIVEPGRQEIADPVVDVISEGVVMSVRAMQAADALYGLRLQCSSAQLERPIPTRRYRLSPANPTEVEIAMPQLRTAKVEATVLTPDGGGVLLLASGPSDDRSLAILVSFRRVPIVQEAEETDPR